MYQTVPCLKNSSRDVVDMCDVLCKYVMQKLKKRKKDFMCNNNNKGIEGEK